MHKSAAAAASAAHRDSISSNTRVDAGANTEGWEPECTGMG